MQITRELLQQRREQIVADMNALHGALQDIDYWLQVLDEPSVPDVADVVETLTGGKVEEVIKL